MPYCPSCRAEYRPGIERCSDCDVELVATLPEAAEDEEWLPVYTEKGPVLDAVEDNLRSRGFRVVRGSVEQSGVSLPIGMVGTSMAALYTLAVPRSEWEARREELGSAIAELSGAEPGDPEAMAEAEQDFDVRGCPGCGLFFHDNYTVCPFDGRSLVPAVEIFAEGQLEPERVVVADGPEDSMAALGARLEAAGYQPEVRKPENWPVAVLSLPWGELVNRTEAAEAILGEAQP